MAFRIPLYPKEIINRISYIGLFLDDMSISLLIDTLHDYSISSHSIVKDPHVTILHSPNQSLDLSILNLIGQEIELEAFAYVQGKKALAILVQWIGGNTTDIFNGEAAQFILPQISMIDIEDELVDIPDITQIQNSTDKDNELKPENTSFVTISNNQLVYTTLGKLSSNALSINPFPHITLYLDDAFSGRISNEIIRQGVERKCLKVLPHLNLHLTVGVAIYTSEGRKIIKSTLEFNEWVQRKLESIKAIQPV